MRPLAWLLAALSLAASPSARAAPSAAIPKSLLDLEAWEAWAAGHGLAITCEGRGPRGGDDAATCGDAHRDAARRDMLRDGWAHVPKAAWMGADGARLDGALRTLARIVGLLHDARLPPIDLLLFDEVRERESARARERENVPALLRTFPRPTSLCSSTRRGSSSTRSARRCGRCSRRTGTTTTTGSSASARASAGGRRTATGRRRRARAASTRRRGSRGTRPSGSRPRRG